MPESDSIPPEIPYVGPERRIRNPAVVVEQHAAPTVPGYKDMSMWQKAWANFGALGLGALMLVSFFLFFQSMYKDEIHDRRSRDAEDREIRRAEVAQQDRRAEQMAGELRIMRVAFESVATRIEAGTTRMEAAKLRLEQLAKDLEGVVKKIIESLNKPTELIVPMGEMIKRILTIDQPELAPMPRKILIYNAQYERDHP